MKTTLWLGLAAACGLSLWGAAEEGTPTPERVRALLAQMDEADYDVREAAQAELVKIGPQAWPQLEASLEDSDPELALRLKKLAQRWEILTKDQAPIAEIEKKNLFASDRTARAEACDRLLALGPAGIKVLKEQLRSDHGKPVLDVSLSKTVFGCEEVVEPCVSVRNEGYDPIWTWWRSSVVLFGWDNGTELGESRQPGMRRVGGLRRFGCGGYGGYVNPIYQWTPIPPGASWDLPEGSFNSKRWPTYFRIMGVYGLDVSARFPGGTMKPRLDPLIPIEVDIEIGKGMPEEVSSVSRHLDFAVFPDFNRAPDDPMLAVDCRTATQEGAPGGKLPATVRFTPQGDGPLVLEENLAGYAWYAFLDEEGMPVRSGSLFSALAKPDEARREAVVLAEQQACEFELDLPLPTEPGAYRLVVGYETGSRYSIFREVTPCFGSVGLASEAMKYDEGRIWTKPVDVRVQAPASATTAGR